VVTNLIFFVIFITHIYTTSQKTVQNYFCHNFVKFPPTVKIFGT